MTDRADGWQELRELAQTFAAAELRPHCERWDREGALDDAVMARLGGLGCFAVAVPEAAGGMGLPLPGRLQLLEPLAWGEASAALAVALHTRVVRVLVERGSEAARQRWLAALATGSTIGCAAAMDADPGLRAEPATAGWALNGTVPWVGNARAGGLLLARATVAGGAAWFLVPLDTTGVSREAPRGTLGLRPLAPRTVALHEVRLETDAHLPAGSQDSTEDALAAAAIAAGIARAALEHARDYAGVREQFGRRLREFEGMQHKLADMAIQVAAAAALVARSADRPELAPPAAAKVFAAESALRVAIEAVQVLGGYGYMKDYPVEKLLRDARALSLVAGADDRYRADLARWLYEG